MNHNYDEFALDQTNGLQPLFARKTIKCNRMPRIIKNQLSVFEGNSVLPQIEDRLPLIPFKHPLHWLKTHVSLLPPPCEEFTTSDPSFSATRVNPPGTIVTLSPYST